MASGSFSLPIRVIGLITGYNNAAVTDELYLLETQLPCECRLGGIQVGAATAGSGTGSTIIDVFINGTSVWANSSNRPTLAAASTGAFTSTRVTNRALRVGDVLVVQVKEIPTSTGHARLRWCIAIERP